jgi:hypothetical protein
MIMYYVLKETYIAFFYRRHFKVESLYSSFHFVKKKYMRIQNYYGLSL